MAEPDELYTLRAQFWLGHYSMAVDEAKSVMRRPMSPELKAEREIFQLRAQLALGEFDRVIASGADAAQPALKALALKAQYDSTKDESQKLSIVQELQSMLGDGVLPSVQLIAAQVFLAQGMKREALQCVHTGATLEQTAVALQVYLQIDRLDLAKNQLAVLRRADEDSILTQLASVYVSLATGSSLANDAVHTINQLSEQYGPSVLLLNLHACALMSAGNYSEAESRLEQARIELGATDADTICNLILAYQYQSKATAELVQQLKTHYPDHFLSKGLDMVEGAFEREAIKYKATA